MSDLEVSNVGEALSKQYLEQISEVIGLPAEVCGILLKSGWTLELDQYKPAMWIHPSARLIQS